MKTKETVLLIALPTLLTIFGVCEYKILGLIMSDAAASFIAICTTAGTLISIFVINEAVELGQ